MKSFTIASVVALASVASAQLDNIPSCALNCFVGPLTNDGCESLTDFECHCQNGPALIAEVQPCVEDACSDDDLQAAMSAVQSTCEQAGVPINIPDDSAAPSAVSSALASASAVVSEIASEIVESASEALESAPVVTATATSTDVVVVPTPTPTSDDHDDDDDSDDDDDDDYNESVVATATMPEFTGGAAQATQAAGILGAAALAMLAL